MIKANIKTHAAIIIIGNEILSGRTQDLNVSFLSKWLNDLGVRVAEVRIIEDNEESIIKCVCELRDKYKYIFTTGGIGPTHDDITSKSISKAFNLKYDFHKEAYAILEKYYKPGEFNEGRQKMAWMPANANLILNPTSGAPGFNIENVFCLPGVPSILKSMLGGITHKLTGGDPIISQTINLRTVESEISKSLSNVQDNNKDVDIGSYPFFKAGRLGVAIVLRCSEQNKIDKCNLEIIKFVKEKNIEIVEKD